MYEAISASWEMKNLNLNDWVKIWSKSVKLEVADELDLNITSIDKVWFKGIWKLIVKLNINKPILFVI